MPYYLHISDCPQPCILSDFVARSLPLIPTDWEVECGNVQLWFGLSLYTLLCKLQYSNMMIMFIMLFISGLFISLCVVMCIIVILLISVIIYFIYKRRQKYTGMTLIPTNHNSSDSDLNELIELEELQ